MKEQEVYNDEISLVGLFKVIKKRKNTFYIVFILTVILAVAVTVIMEPVYKSKAVILIGNVEPVLELVKRLQEEYRVDGDSELEILSPYVSKISFNKKASNNIIEINVEDITVAGAQAYLAQVTEKLLKEHGVLYKKAVVEQMKLLSGVMKYHQEYTQQLDLMGRQIKHLEKTNPEHASLVSIEKGRFLISLPELENEIVKIELALSGIHTKPTALLRNSTLPRKADS